MKRDYPLARVQAPGQVHFPEFHNRDRFPFVFSFNFFYVAGLSLPITTKVRLSTHRVTSHRESNPFLGTTQERGLVWMLVRS
jgi:hypothetical protein